MNAAGQPPRLPKNYRLIYEILHDAGHGVHFTMGDVFALAKRKQPAIGFSTVYRGIARLRDIGCIDEIELPGTDSAVYELKGTPHAHFRCERCGRVEDVAYQLPVQTIAALARRAGATIDTATLSLRGTCRDCAAS
jgi:Fur family peroxide stress response transcriptional regulator